MITIKMMQGIINEYGLEEFKKRINKSLNIELPIKDYSSMTLFSDNTIRIEETNPIEISMEDGLYKVVTEFSTYKTIKYYYNKELIRHLFAFNTEDEKLIVLDHIDNGNFKTTRISKTTMEDKDFNKGEYEREMTTFPVIPIDISSHYFNNEGNIDEERIIDLAGQNYYYHHYIGNNNSDYFQESSMCQDTPFVKISGHLRVNDDLLKKSFDFKRGNIVIRGINTDENNNPQEFYQSIFEFTKEGFIIIDTTVDYPDNNIDTKKTIARTNQTKFSSTLVDTILTLIAQRNIINPNHLENISTELNRIKEALLIQEHKKLRDLSRIELMMSVISNLNELAYNIYENQSEYENIINSELETTKSKSLK